VYTVHCTAIDELLMAVPTCSPIDASQGSYRLIHFWNGKLKRRDGYLKSGFLRFEGSETAPIQERGTEPSFNNCCGIVLGFSPRTL
jgi:hypothetical protein